MLGSSRAQHDRFEGVAERELTTRGRGATLNLLRRMKYDILGKWYSVFSSWQKLGRPGGTEEWSLKMSSLAIGN